MKEPEASNAEFMLMLLAAIERRDIELLKSSIIQISSFTGHRAFL
jgi:hypothetical protein